MDIHGNDRVSRQTLAIDRLFQIPRKVKQAILIAFDLCVIPFAVWLAVLVRWGGFVFEFTYREVMAVLLTVVISAFIFVRIGLYRAVVRYMGQQAILTVVKGVTWSSIVLAILLFLFRSEIPRSSPLIYWAVAMFFIGGSRLLVRTGYQNLYRWSGKKVAIYGAGASGRQLLQSLFQSGEFAPMVFLDDNPGLQGTVINGIPVYAPRELSRLIMSMDIACVLLAIPTVDRIRRRKIIENLEKLPIHVKTVPSFSVLVSGLARVDDIMDIDVEDLLGREPVPPQPELLKKCIAGKVVLVTGAGGSIGAELCRQILPCRPKELVLIDVSEYGLYKICRELREVITSKHLNTALIPLLGNVQNENKMRNIFQGLNVETVYHAAAYKHVPIVQSNITEGIENNIFGTLSASRAAIAANVETFVLISTDKAVRPTNIMGASKRIAELVVQAFAARPERTAFSVVRFGNVLGSSGSVVPLFREQIGKGGPVTVTHPDVQRYFMTIPEAAQLVLQAGAMGSDGDVFVLDMGEPVKIIDLARRMVKLMGHVEKDGENPNGDIEIKYVGLRPGEKLFEELLLGDKVIGTGHPKILRAQEEWLPEEKLQEVLIALRRACDAGDCAAVQNLLSAVVNGFEGTGLISDEVWLRKDGAAAKRGNVYTLFVNE
jgi:FlaA1/EpsC-like NDP-sugar epimerase